MRKRILKKIQKAQAASICGMELVQRHRGPSKKQPDFVKRTNRDEVGNHLDKDGNLILSHVRTSTNKTMTPSEQYRKSTLKRIVSGTFHLTSKETD